MTMTACVTTLTQILQDSALSARVAHNYNRWKYFNRWQKMHGIPRLGWGRSHTKNFLYNIFCVGTKNNLKNRKQHSRLCMPYRLVPVSLLCWWWVYFVESLLLPLQFSLALGMAATCICSNVNNVRCSSYQPRRLPSYVFYVCLLKNEYNKYQKYKSVELGDQLLSTPLSSPAAD